MEGEEGGMPPWVAMATTIGLCAVVMVLLKVWMKVDNAISIIEELDCGAGKRLDKALTIIEELEVIGEEAA